MLDTTSTPDTQFAHGEAESTEQPLVFSPLISSYQERGFDAGYSRGRNDALMELLAAVDEFASLQPGSVAQTRRLLFAFSAFLEKRLVETPPGSQSSFIDGLGI